MKKIIYTQRVETIESYQERRDCADQRIPEFLYRCGYLPVPIPNRGLDLEAYFYHENPDGLLFTGGNSLAKYGGDAPERDKTEQWLLKEAIRYKIPVYGFCRGMQMILDFFNVPLVEVEGHVAVRHTVSGVWGERQVNSYHQQAADHAGDEFMITAVAEDGIIEAIAHKKYPIIGTMWHPEREMPFEDIDVSRVKELFR